MTAVREIKTTLAIDGEKKFKEALDQAYRGMKVLGSEMRLNTEIFSENGSGMEALTRKGEILRGEVSQQKEIVAALTKALQEAATTYGATDKKTDEYRVKLNNANAALRSMQSELKDTEKKTTGLGAVFTAVKEKTDKWKTALKGVSDGLGTAIGAASKMTAGIAAVGAAAVAAGAQVFNMTADMGKLADNLLTTSAQTGVSTKTLQEWSYAAEFIDTDVDTMTGAMAKMINQLDSVASGSGDTARAFKKLHVSIKENGELKDSETLFLELVDALGKVENETQRDQLAMQIFGKSAQELNPLILAGSAGLAKYSQEAQNAGVVMSDETVAAFGAFDDQMNVVNATLTGVKQNFVAALLPAMEKLLPVVQDIAARFSEWLQSDAAQTLLSGLADKIAVIASDFSGNLGPAIDSVISAFTTIVNTVSWVAENFQTLVTVGGVLAGVLVALQVAQIAVNIAMAANPIGLVVMAIAALVAGIAVLIVNWDSVTAALSDGLNAMAQGWDWFVGQMDAAWQSVVQGASSAWEGIKGAFSGVVDWVGGIINSIGAAFSRLWNAMVSIGANVVQGLISGIVSAGQWLYNKLVGWVNSVIGWIKNLFGIHSPSTKMSELIGKPMAQGVALGITKNAGLVSSAFESLMPDAASTDVVLGVTRRFQNVAMQAERPASPATQYAAGGTDAAAANGSKAAAGGVSVTQNIYANETSYAGQQKLAAREMRMLAREMSW